MTPLIWSVFLKSIESTVDRRDQWCHWMYDLPLKNACLVWFNFQNGKIFWHAFYKNGAKFAG